MARKSNDRRDAPDFERTFERVVDISDSNKAVEVAKAVPGGKIDESFCTIRHLIYSKKKESWVQKYGSGIVVLPQALSDDPEAVNDFLVALGNALGYRVSVNIDISKMLDD